LGRCCRKRPGGKRPAIGARFRLLGSLPVDANPVGLDLLPGVGCCQADRIRLQGVSARARPRRFGNMPFGDSPQDAVSIPGWVGAAPAAEIDIAGTGQPHRCRAHRHSRPCSTPRSAQRRPNVWSDKNLSVDRSELPRAIGLARSASPTFRSLLERASIGHARRHSIRIRGKRADVWSPHTVLGRGVSCRNIVARSHGLGCEYGCRDQCGRHEGHFGHWSLSIWWQKSGNDRLPAVKSDQPWEIFHHALSTKRELLWSHPVAPAAMPAGEYVRREIMRAVAIAAISDASADRRTGSAQREPVGRQPGRKVEPIDDAFAQAGHRQAAFLKRNTEIGVW
jgi:hypothetical protein